MLTDPEDIRLAASAQEAGIRRPNRSPRGPAEILRDFLPGISLPGQRILELGPGHYEFCDAIHNLGATAEAIEFDPPVAEIGRRHGYKIYQHNLRDLTTFTPEQPYDGLFGKGSNNPFWFYADEAALEAYILKLRSLVRPEGWIWIVSCPFTPLNLTPESFNRWLNLESQLHLRHGFREWHVTSAITGGFYGVSVPCDNLRVFTFGLPEHRWSLRSRLQFAAFSTRRHIATTVRRLIRH